MGRSAAGRGGVSAMIRPNRRSRWTNGPPGSSAFRHSPASAESARRRCRAPISPPGRAPSRCSGRWGCFNPHPASRQGATAENRGKPPHCRGRSRGLLPHGGVRAPRLGSRRASTSRRGARTSPVECGRGGFAPFREGRALAATIPSPPGLLHCHDSAIRHGFKPTSHSFATALAGGTGYPQERARGERITSRGPGQVEASAPATARARDSRTVGVSPMTMKAY